VQNLKILNFIGLFYCRSVNRVQTQCFARVSPTATLRIHGLAKWKLVHSGFKVDCEYKLNR